MWNQCTCITNAQISLNFQYNPDTTTASGMARLLRHSSAFTSGTSIFILHQFSAALWGLIGALNWIIGIVIRLQRDLEGLHLQFDEMMGYPNAEPCVNSKGMHFFLKTYNMRILRDGTCNGMYLNYTLKDCR